MITVMDRLVDLIAKIEQGEDVDLDTVSRLQALDVARLGREFVEDAIKRDEEADDQLERFASGE